MNPTEDGRSLEDIAIEVEDIRANTVAGTSRTIYRNSYARFLTWLACNKQHLVTEHFLTQLDTSTSDTAMRKRIIDVMKGDRGNPPIHFDLLEARDFITWLLTLKKRDGSTPGYSTYNSHRAGLFNLFRHYGISMSRQLESELSTHFKGLKRRIATNTTAGLERVKTGKDPMPFGFYQSLCGTLLEYSSKDMLFARTFLIICWNLMCRSYNAFHIRHGHIEWVEDSMCIYFAHMKNDQQGERPRDPRHIYANPLQPEVCPILALGIYWSCFEWDEDNDQLFPGDNQYDRFRKQLHRILQKEKIVQELDRRGMDAEHIGTHSVRKGAATFCSSGSTSCPSSTSIHLRAGWSLGGVQNTYLRYESAGDMYVGRTVCGLPSDSYLFAILPPHFTEKDSIIQEALDAIYPTLPKCLNYVAEFALASLVYHVAFLKKQLHPDHRLFKTPLFQNKNLLGGLSHRVKCSMSSPVLKASGIPPHTKILAQMMDLQTKAIETMEAIEENRMKVVKEIIRELEDRAIEARTVTYDGLDDRIMSCLDRAGIPQLLQRLDNSERGTNAEREVDLSSEDSTQLLRLHFWQGKYRRVPQDFSFPDCGVLIMWQLWMCGNETKEWPPFRWLDTSDLSTKNLKKRYSDLCYLMKGIEDESKLQGIQPRGTPSIDQVNDIFQKCRHVVEISPATNCQRKRRKAQLSWRTVVNILRQEEKIRRKENS